MATIQSGLGKIVMFEDFCGAQMSVAETIAAANLGSFCVTGLNSINSAAGVPTLQTAGLNGVGRMTTYTGEQDSIFIRTGECFDVALMGPLLMECRIKAETLTNQQNWFGLVNISGVSDTIEDHIIDTSNGSTTIAELTATHMCGFLRTGDLAASTEWHAIWKGGTTSAPTLTTQCELNVNMVAGDWQVLRLEVDPNGTARWYIDGVLLKTLAGAVSTTEDLAVILALDNLTATAAREMDVDYIMVKANRDWTV